MSAHSYPEGQLLIRHERFEAGLTFTIACPQFLPGCKHLVAVLVTSTVKPKMKQWMMSGLYFQISHHHKWDIWMIHRFTLC